MSDTKPSEEKVKDAQTPMDIGFDEEQTRSSYRFSIHPAIRVDRDKRLVLRSSSAPRGLTYVELAYWEAAQAALLAHADEIATAAEHQIHLHESRMSTKDCDEIYRHWS